MSAWGQNAQPGQMADNRRFESLNTQPVPQFVEIANALSSANSFPPFQSGFRQSFWLADGHNVAINSRLDQVGCARVVRGNHRQSTRQRFGYHLREAIL